MDLKRPRYLFDGNVSFFTGPSAKHVFFFVNRGNSQKLFCFGFNEYGQLGLRDSNNRVQIVEQVYFTQANERVANIICGQRHTVFHLKSGRVFSCGFNQGGELMRDIPKENSNGQQDYGSIESYTFNSTTRGCDLNIGPVTDLGVLSKNPIKIFGGNYSNFLMETSTHIGAAGMFLFKKRDFKYKYSSDLKGWNSNGLLGVGGKVLETAATVQVPQKVMIPSNDPIRYIESTFDSAVFLATCGKVYCSGSLSPIGSGLAGSSGDHIEHEQNGHYTPILIQCNERFIHVTASGTISYGLALFLTSDNRVFVSGYKNIGKLFPGGIRQSSSGGSGFFEVTPQSFTDGNTANRIESLKTENPTKTGFLFQTIPHRRSRQSCAPIVCLGNEKIVLVHFGSHLGIGKNRFLSSHSSSSSILGRLVLAETEKRKLRIVKCFSTSKTAYFVVQNRKKSDVFDVWAEGSSEMGMIPKQQQQQQHKKNPPNKGLNLKGSRNKDLLDQPGYLFSFRVTDMVKSERIEFMIKAMKKRGVLGIFHFQNVFK